jgi:hypothetical protein
VISEERRNQVLRSLVTMERERANWEPLFRELEENFAPRRARWEPTDTPKAAQVSANDSIYDGAPLYALRVLKSGMMGGHTSPSRPWFRLITPDPDLMEFGPVKQWLYVVEQRMRTVFARSNIYNSLPVFYGDLAVYGTAALGLFGDDQDVVRAYPYVMGSYYVANGARLSVNRVARRWRSTVANVAEEFGQENLSTSAKRSLETKNWGNPVDVCHIVQPNPEADPRYADSRSMPYESLYWEKGFPDGKILRREGFREMPILVARWEAVGEDAYGIGPCMDAMGDAKQLQFETLRAAQMIDKLTEPSWNVPAALANRPKSMLPGGYNYVPDTANGIRPVYEVDPRAVQILNETRIDLRNRLNQSLYVDMFLMLAQSDRRQITAREVEERHSEKLMLIGPVLERLSDELLDPLIDRTFRLMLEAGEIPPWPEELERMPLKIEYISILAQAQKAIARSSIEAVAGFAASLSQLNPEVLDKLDTDQSIDEYADMVGAPPTIVRSDEAVAAMRRKRAQDAAAAQAAQMAEQMAGAAQKLGNTPMGQDSALDRMTG